MPNYVYRCSEHGEWEEWASIHDDTRTAVCDCGSVSPKVMTPPRISVHATPHKGEEARSIDRREARWSVDMPAYKELRRQGYQPKQIDGSHVLARDAKDRIEVEMGRAYPKDRLNQAKEVRAELQEQERLGATSVIGDYVRKRGSVTA